jgi:hypothetical protein
MPVIMIDHSRRLREPLPWGRREKTVVAILLSCVLLAGLGLAAYGLSSGAPARRGCIAITFASTLGGAEAKACGARARAICATPQDYAHSGEQLQQACRRAGLPYVPRG